MIAALIVGARSSEHARNTVAVKECWTEIVCWCILDVYVHWLVRVSSVHVTNLTDNVILFYVWNVDRTRKKRFVRTWSCFSML